MNTAPTVQVGQTEKVFRKWQRFMGDRARSVMWQYLQQMQAGRQRQVGMERTSCTVQPVGWRQCGCWSDVNCSSAYTPGAVLVVWAAAPVTAAVSRLFVSITAKPPFTAARWQYLPLQSELMHGWRVESLASWVLPRRSRACLSAPTLRSCK